MTPSSVREFVTRLGRRFHIGEMAKAYQLTFLSSPGATTYVLPDLLEYTGALDPAPKDGDAFTQGRAAGRRDVWLHIASYLHLKDEELFALYAGRQIIPQQEKRR